MHITRKNFEAFLLDYHEGSLDAQGIKELMLFLEVNPDLGPLIDEKPDLYLAEENGTLLFGKEKLRRKVIPAGTVNEQSIEEYLIGRIERVNSESEEMDLNAFLKNNPAYHHDLELYRKTIAEPDERIIYEDKERLKRSPAILNTRKSVFYAAAAAAAILIYLGSAYFFRQPVTDNKFDAMADLPDGTPLKASPTIIKAITPFRYERTEPSFRETETGRLPGIQVPSTRRDVTEPVLIEPVIALLEQGETIPEAYAIPARDKPILTETPRTENRSGLIGKILGNLALKTRDVLAERTERKKVTTGDDHSGFWKMAAAGLKGYNVLTDNDLALEVNRDQDGKITSYRVTDQSQVMLSHPKEKE